MFLDTLRFCLAPILTTTVLSSISANYSSALTNSSAAYMRTGNSGSFYYEAIEVTATLTGRYTFLSSSNMDTYGFLYQTGINPSNLSATLLILDDDSGGNNQFLFTYTLEAGNTYIVICTTFSAMVTGPFSLGIYGPSRVSLRRIDLSLAISSTRPTTSEYDGLIRRSISVFR